MNQRKAVEPSTLPPDPSMGELVTEIDRARHDAARTVNELTRRFDPRSKVPENVAEYLRTALRYTKQVPTAVWVTAAIVLVWSLRRRKR